MTPSQPDPSGPIPGAYRKFAFLFGAATATMGLLGLLGWLGMPLLASVRSSYIPMAPLTAIIFICLGGLLLVRSRALLQGQVGKLAAAFSALSALLLAYVLIELLNDLGFPVPSLEEWLFPNPAILGATPAARMSPVTKVLFLLSGAVVPMLFLRERGGKRERLVGDLAGGLGLLVAVVGTVFILGYLHGAPLLYHTSTVPMAATTALGFLFLGAGQIFAAGPGVFPLRPFVGPSARARLLRVFVSTTVGVVLAIDLMHVYAPGIFFKDNAFMSGISITAFAVMTGALIARVALKVGGDMDRSEGVRKQAEEALRSSEARYRAVTHSAPDAIVSADSAGNIVHWNAGAETIFGYSEVEVIGQPAALLIPSRFQEEHLAGMARMRAGGEPHVLGKIVEREGVRKDGSEFPIEFSLAAWQVADRRYYTAIIRDITDRKRAEEALAQSLEQLRQSQKVEAVGRLAGGVAHDFNNLLTVITGYCELVRNKIGEGNSLLQDLQEIGKAADRAAALTRQLLAFSRRQILQPKVLEIDTVIPEMDNMLRRLIGEDVNLATILGAGDGKVKVDPSQIEQVIVNLVINSRDAMPDGGTITIETGNVELDEAYVRLHGGAWPGPHVMLAVSDTGCGMDPETLSKAFEPFFTTKEKGKGTGLGLSTVFGIVKQSGGCIYGYSEPGRGTAMKIYLPRVTGKTAPKDEKRDAGFDDRLQGSETILLVEDDETLRKLASTILEGYRYTVLSAGNGEEALQLLNDSPAIPHLLLTDVVMPKMSGRGLSDRVKAIHPGTRVLFMSGYTDNAIVHHGVLDQGVSFIGKPYTPLALSRKVREVLDKA